MAISRMTKVLIVGHISEFNSFVTELQKSALIHLTNLCEKTSDEKSQAALKELDKSNPLVLSGLEEMSTFLNGYRLKESFLQKLLSPPRMLKRDDFNTITGTVNPESLLARFRDLRSALDSLKQEKERLLAENEALELWKQVNTPLNETGDHGEWSLVLGRIEERFLDQLKDAAYLDCEVIFIQNGTAVVLAAFHKNIRGEAEELLQSIDFVPCTLQRGSSSPAQRYARNSDRLQRINTEVEDRKSTVAGLVDEYDRVMVLLQYFHTMEMRSRVFERWLATENAFILTGWVKQDDRERLAALITDYDTLSFEEVEPEKGEKPPVAFANLRLFAPFQLLTRLYSYPSHESIDPSPVLSIYFALFFGITLTDAGYGLVLVLIALFGLAKFSGGRDILWIIFWGGSFTILAGLLTGGIFGDLFRLENPFISVPFISELREKLLWFDPMKEPMTFFRVVLLLGVAHIVTGMVMGLVSHIKQKKYGDAMVENGAWLLILFSLLTVLFATNACISMSLVTSKEPPLPAQTVAPAFVVLVAMSLVIILFGARNEKSLFFRFFIGFLKLVVLSGVFSYLGDILSYIRLMALGMVTAGIGMAVNTIAFLMIDIPVIGIVFTVFVLLLGHLFNLVINLLGGFVHTLRLQYVEFFSKFFAGGGEPFAPLSESRKYIEITD